MTSREQWDPYVVLGVPRQASAKEIASAYRRAARMSHPDSGDAGSAERFQAVSDAYDVLRNSRRRAIYDRSHPLARSRGADARGGSVRYEAPSQQHIVLGRESSPAAVPQLGDAENLLRIALSLLRAGLGP